MAYHHGDLGNALLDAATAHLDATGEIPSLRAIAVACGVSHGAPYRHFRDADDLRGAVAARAYRDLTEAILAAGAGVTDPPERLAAGCSAYVAWGLRHHGRYTLMFGIHSPVVAHEGCQEAASAAFATLVDAVAACGSPDPGRTASVCWAALHGAVAAVLPVGPRGERAGLGARDRVPAPALTPCAGFALSIERRGARSTLTRPSSPRTRASGRRRR